MRLWCGILGLLFLAFAARADTIYDINATATVTGNDVCGGVCVEAVSFSLQLDANTTDVLPGGTFTSSGPIPYGSGSIEPGPLDPVTGSIGLGYGGDDLVINLGCGGSIPLGYPSPCTPRLGWTGIVSCADQTCVDDFCFSEYCYEVGTVYCYDSGSQQYVNEPYGTPWAPGCFIDGGGGQLPLSGGGSVVGTITIVPSNPVATPEPGELELALLGLLALALWKLAANAGSKYHA